ncbi:MAG: hypothetical protein ACR2PW_07785 [Gammaproteobacteria bacterium]
MDPEQNIESSTEPSKKNIFDESKLKKYELKKLATLKKAVGDKIAQDAFLKWKKEQSREVDKKDDPVALQIYEAINNLGDLNLGIYGYTITKGRGRGTKGLRVIKNSKAGS